MSTYDQVITGAQIASPDRPELIQADIAISGGKVAAVGRDLAGLTDETFDASGLVAFPGVVDAHQHWGIYNDLSADADSESRASAQGGVTTGLTYMRTGQYYMNKSGPYAEIFPEVLERTQGRSFIDYGYHLAPMIAAYRRDRPAHRRLRRGVLQDLHVLRQPRPARPVG
jgi:allantoinase